MSNFTFLQLQFPTLHSAAVDAERYIEGDPRVACVYARRAVEVWVGWVYEYDKALSRSYDGDNLAALLGRYDFQRAVRTEIVDKAHRIRKIGNLAVHSGQPISQRDALQTVKELFQMMRWHANRYGAPDMRGSVPTAFDLKSVPRSAETMRKLTRKALKMKLDELEERDSALQQAKKQLATLRDQMGALQEKFAPFEGVDPTQLQIAEAPAAYYPSGKPTEGEAAAQLFAKLQSVQKRAKSETNVDKLQALFGELTNGILTTLGDAVDPQTLNPQRMEALQAEIAEHKAVNEVSAEAQTYSEADTRRFYIDVDLRDAGWDPQAPNVAEYELIGMYGDADKTGYADYVLWGDDGKPLAVVEAKRTSIDAHAGKQQAKLYADALELLFDQRPIIFYTNGHDIYIWDDASGGYPERKIQGYYNKDDLQRLINRRSIPADVLQQTAVNRDISGRPYQTKAIGRITDAFTARRRKGLLHMATGTGKTRTTIGLVDLLLRAGWVKRVLFLADRKALVKQAENAFRQHLPNTDPVNLLELKSADKPDARHARILVSTYHTILNRIDKALDNGQREYGVGHFDLIVIDEAHRSVFRKFRAIFNYFDSHLIGLTATPVAEIDRNTYELFSLETGVPTDSYELVQAVADGWLVPAVPLRVPSLIMDNGLRYDDLSEEEKAHWDEQDWGEDGPRERVSSAEINKVLFNIDTVDRVLELLMRDGIHIAGGDRLGKTIIFARNQAHAELIEERFNHAYPHHAGNFARVISYKEPHAQSIIDKFKEPESDPHIAISVDMLDTGIDVPEVVNLVFFKKVYSRTKFDQMIGRGTRLAPNLFGLGDDKTHFYIFDLCRNFEYFNNLTPTEKPAATRPLRQRIFNRRLDLLTALQQHSANNPTVKAIRDTLHAQVAGMPHENFLVRPHRGSVERFADRAAWDNLDAGDLAEIGAHLSNLPTSADADDNEKTKRFDLLMLQLQLALVQEDGAFAALRDRVIYSASVLEMNPAIPMIAARLDLLTEIQDEAYWTGVTVEILEELRLQLRGLMQFLSPQQQKSVIVNIPDVIGEVQIGRIDEFTAGLNRLRYQETVEKFVHDSESHPVVQKIMAAVPLTEADMSELEDYFYSADATGTRADFEAVYGEQAHLGVFIRSITGLDRAAAKEKFEHYLGKKQFSADQISFIDHLINHLASGKTLIIDDLSEAPFSHIHHDAPFGIFPDNDVERLFDFLDDVNGAIRPNLLT